MAYRRLCTLLATCRARTSTDTKYRLWFARRAGPKSARARTGPTAADWVIVSAFTLPPLARAGPRPPAARHLHWMQ